MDTQLNFLCDNKYFSQRRKYFIVKFLKKEFSSCKNKNHFFIRKFPHLIKEKFQKRDYNLYFKK